jgi:hypothetical protein
VTRLLLLVIGGLWAATGIVIFLDPQGFYDRTPGLALMGPYNSHFIRDVGLAFLASGIATCVGSWRQDRGLALAGTGWPLLHALFHVHIWSHRGFPLDGIAAFDFAAVIAPAFLAAALAWRTGLAEPATRREVGP